MEGRELEGRGGKTRADVPGAEPVSAGSAGRGRSGTGHPVPRLAAEVKVCVLVLGLGLGVVGAGAAYLGLFLVASTLVSIFLVAVTLYAFLRFWPEHDAVPDEREPPQEAAPPPQTPARQVVLPVVRLQGPPRARMMLALRDIARRQDNYRLSPQGAERFARVIRYLLRQG